MIQLDVMDCCKNCFNFTPVLANDFVLTNLGNSELYHRVTCEHMDMCRNMLKFLKEEADKNGK